MAASDPRIVDISTGDKYDRYLQRCLVGPPSKRYRKRMEYLAKAIPTGFHKKLLIFNRQVVGTIEYAPAAASYYPIAGANVEVMNCIWVLRKAKGHDFGRLLVNDMIRSEKGASCFATIALENHWSPWFRRQQMQWLGFKPLDSIGVKHETKHREQMFSIYLMWMQTTANARPPTWNQEKMLEGLTCCIAHPLYHPQTYKPRHILQRR